MDFLVKPCKKQDTPFLWEMLYQSIYVADGDQPLSKDVLKHPSIEKYLKNWGEEKGDYALMAVRTDGTPIGAIWIRKFKKDDAGYGFVDEETPELGMAICLPYRGKGIGRKLLSKMSSHARSFGYQALSLSVSADNFPAIHLYETSGFKKVSEDDGGSWIMQKAL